MRKDFRTSKVGSHGKKNVQLGRRFAERRFNGASAGPLADSPPASSPKVADRRPLSGDILRAESQCRMGIPFQV